MIRRSLFVATLAIVVWLLAHLTGLSLTAPTLTDRSEGSAASDSVELSSAFEDFADEAPEPVQPEPAEAPEPPVETPVEPEPAEIPTSDAQVASPDPQQVFAPDTGSETLVQPEAPDEPIVDPVDGDEGEAEESTETPDVATPPIEVETAVEPPSGTAEIIEPVETQPTTEPVVDEPEQLAALPPAESAPVPVTPLEIAPLEPENPEIAVEPIPEESEPADSEETSEQAVASSPRPRLPDRRPQPTLPGALGTSPTFDDLRFPEQVVESPLTTYSREGRDSFRQSRSGTRSGGRGPGNADTTNYAGRVLVHLNRAPLVYVATNGFAQVFFEINPDGTLAWVDVVDSSGAPDVDRAAKEQVRSAAPFPPPPGGVGRKLSFFYQIR